MTLKKEVYRELEDILGPEYISEEPAILDGYTCFGFGARGAAPADRYFTRPEAVVLPGSVEDVQAIVKHCNRSGVKYRASSTSYGAASAVKKPNTIFIDLRRMNRIIEFDTRNMYIVIEPYVCFAQVQAEAQKRGLNTHVIGAGANCSNLASSTSLHGTATQAISQGWGGRNVLGVEWVLPTGEILRLGSLGSRSGWFTGDGPGPSLRGIMRGAAGALSGLGVFTKVASHLHPWYGPDALEIKGVSPRYETELPPNFEYHIIEWPNWDKCADAQYKIGEANIAFAIHKTGGPGSHGTTICGSNNEYYARWNELKDLPWISYAVVLSGSSSEELDYQKEVLDQIIAETEGKIVPLGEQPFWKNCDFINMVKGCFIPRTAFRAAGAFCCPFQGQESVDHAALTLSLDRDFRKKYEEKDGIFNDGTNNMWGVTFEGSHFALVECGHLYSITEKDSWIAADGMRAEGDEIADNMPVADSWTLMGEEVVKSRGYRCCNVDSWQKRIKKTFDPNVAADPTGYISPDPD